MSDFMQRLNELERRLANIFLLGTIIEADYDNALIKAKSGELETGWLNWITARASNDADWWAPEVGEQVVIMCPNGDPELGVVLPAIYQNKHPAPSNKPTIRKVTFEDGTTVHYDRQSHLLTIDVKGDVHINASGDTQVEASGNVQVKGKVVSLNGGSPCVTTAHICHFTGIPHGDGSTTVTAGK